MTGPRIVGLDLGLKITGLTRADGRPRPVMPAGKGYARHADLARKLEELTRGADLVVIEGYALNAPYKLALVRAGELGGFVRAMLEHHGRRWLDVSPATLKEFATGKGNAGKPAMRDAAEDAGLVTDLLTDDEVDAWWLWRMGRFHYDRDHERLASYVTGAKRYRYDVIAELDWPDL